MAARKLRGTKNSPWHDVVRRKIQAACIEHELIKHVMGKRDMTPTQVTAATKLIDKVLPTMTENKTEHVGNFFVRVNKPGEAK